MTENMEMWEKENGVKFLRKAGLQPGQTVLDFGCGVGHYTVPAAFVVGSKGVVYAMDKEQQAINELQQKAKANNLKNIKVIKTSSQIKLEFESESIDIVLFYDVLHYLGKKERQKLYHQAYRVLKQNGLFSIYPKHTLEDNPIMEFQNRNLKDIKQEIQNSNFAFEKKHCGIISHDNGLNKGCVLNFRKQE
jgi:ubiquinone/menaquinone biosynthesis C-methylase UbiE